MQAAANGLLLLEAVLFFVAGYRLGWVVSVDAGAMPPQIAATMPRLRWYYGLSMVLAFVCLILAGLHLAARSLLDMGDGASQAGVGAAVVMGLVVAWFSYVSARNAR